MGYEELLVAADNIGLITKEKPLLGSAGRIKGNRIAIKKDLPLIEKTCVLAEELGHHYTTAGDILDQTIPNNCKQEQRARAWAYDLLVTPRGIINCYLTGCRNRYEIAEHLGVTEEFFEDAINMYRRKYGTRMRYGNFQIVLEPYLGVLDMNMGQPVL